MTHHGDIMVTWPLLPTGTWLSLLWGWCQKLAQDPTMDSWERKLSPMALARQLEDPKQQLVSSPHQAAAKVRARWSTSLSISVPHSPAS